MESNSPVDLLSGKLSGISISGSGNDWSKIGKGWRSPASSVIPSGSPSPDLVIHHREHTRQQNRSLAESNGGSSVQGDSDKAEAIRFSKVERKKDFKHMERVNGRLINVVEGLELHKGIFSDAEQKKIVNCVYDFQEKGRKNQLRARTYSEPRKWMRGKGRVTIQFGCCYNYATDKNGNPPGIIRDEEVDPIPPLLKSMIKRMVSWHVLPPTCIPNSCIVNIYDKDDCIPPHIDHHDFVRPFCTVSFLTECNILFGAELRILGPGEFSGSTAIPLPLGSVLILKGNGADVSKHCVPAVPAKRISITFRKMDDSKLPFRFIPDPELQNLRPLAYPPKGGSAPLQRAVTRVLATPHQASAPSQVHQVSSHLRSENSNSGHQKREEQKNKLNVTGEGSVSPFQLGQDEFPPLCSSSVDVSMRKPRRSLRQ